MSQPPALTAEQRTAALEKAKVARQARAEIKEKLKMRAIDLEGLLELADNDQTIGKMKALAMLESLPGVGKVKARRAMDVIGISHSRRLRGLGDQQRKALLDQFGDR